MQRNVKIVATIGPATASEEKLEALINAGMNVARLNFSHGTQEEHAARIEKIRRLAKKTGHAVGILQDLQGPKIRVGDLDATLQLAEGEQICFYATGEEVPCDAKKIIPVDFHELFEFVQEGNLMLLDDGRLSLRVESVHERSLQAVVLEGGPLSSHKGINLPGVRLQISSYTSKDKDDLAFGIAHGVDAVAVSFVRAADDMKLVRKEMERLAEGTAPMLIAKLERPEAMDNLDEIIEVVDGVMVARGDLGIEMPPERVPVLQKMIIQKASSEAKIVITATQMLETMIHEPLPTRAEASDIANAVFDGTDAVMLSAETAIGKFPIRAVKMMERIILEAETHMKEWGTELDHLSGIQDEEKAAMSRAAYELANDKNVEAIAVFTAQGSTAWLVAKIRPTKCILAFTPYEKTYGKLPFLWGVEPRLAPIAHSLEEMIANLDEALLTSGLEEGTLVAVLCGFPIGAMKPPNMALLHIVGESSKEG